MAATHVTWVEIDSKAIRHNVRLFRKLIGQHTKFMAVVKSNAYGHGLVETARLAANAGANWIGTVNVAEALTLRQQGIRQPILALSFFDPNLLPAAIRADIALPVYHEAAASSISRLATRLKKIARVHLKLDTGTTRVGVDEQRLFQLANHVTKLPSLRLDGVFTHFAEAEIPSQRVTNRQFGQLITVVAKLKKAGVSTPYTHAACSAATLLNRGTHLDMVRVGISLYGLWSVEDGTAATARLQKRLPLRPALSWRTRIIQVKQVPAGTRIGYGGTYRTKRPATIAVLPIGYWDGYDRKLSNRGVVLVCGQRCPVRGRICMNLTMVDVTGVRGVTPGTMATLIGREGKAKVTADELAAAIGTINYEIVTRINPLLPRVYR